MERADEICALEWIAADAANDNAFPSCVLARLRDTREPSTMPQ